MLRTAYFPVELRVNDLIGKVQITVKDHGPGVPADMLQRILIRCPSR